MESRSSKFRQLFAQSCCVLPMRKPWAREGVSRARARNHSAIALAFLLRRQRNGSHLLAGVIHDDCGADALVRNILEYGRLRAAFDFLAFLVVLALQLNELAILVNGVRFGFLV